ncbi:alginate lyase family protein [Nonlabens xiamenensis]|uniref:alginate lyase family protein n=1 Tax=Nonlabens xiamenensis TaxID=2341043 RepID=UPI000F615714|nr:alginate lyase family protein [Nonlabens xiamenensis]
MKNSPYLLLLIGLMLMLTSCHQEAERKADRVSFDLFAFEKKRILVKADSLKDFTPVTITANIAERSAGGPQDFYSEGDYWWPNPEDPNGPYIRRDGQTNPDNFTAHRHSLIRFAQIVGALTSAYQITGDNSYVNHLEPHLRAWFVNPDTRMNPNLMFAQAIKGKVTGRGIGIIDTVHLVEVALAVELLEKQKQLPAEDLKVIKNWFSDYSLWLTTHPFGLEEKNNGNNHSVTWALQVAAFAKASGNTKLIEEMRAFYKEVLLPEQMALNGGFPKELDRTKPYGYSIFNLDAMTALVQLLSTPQSNLFTYQTDDGKGLQIAMEFLYPYLKDQSTWPYQKDVMYWDHWPVAQPCLLFSSQAFKNDKYLQLWKELDRNFDETEVVRNMPVKHYTLWFPNNPTES